jgi:8-oxo-dGTP pyrophosphatase MutT (NUDIX family)
MNHAMTAAMQSASSPILQDFSPAQFRAYARRTFAQTAEAAIPNGKTRGPSDLDLDPNPNLEAELAILGTRPAAVLVPVIARPELTLLFTRRADHLPAHAGQISFPGGKVEESDDGPIATALREAEEEIGLTATVIEPLGFLEPYRTGTGFCITPVIALIQPEFTLTLNSEEVAETFEVPLQFLMDPRNHQTHARTLDARKRRFYAMTYGERFIWGATAGILKNMHERLYGS